MIATPATKFPGPSPTPSSVSGGPLADLLGLDPNVKDGMVKFSKGREGAMHGVEIGGSMGLGTWAAFTGNDELAVVGGDFIMTGEDVQPVLRALRSAGINIVTLHNHMIGETPTFYFVHFWGKGDPEELAAGLKKALDAQEAGGK